MHDLDRTQFESSYEAELYATGYDDEGEYEAPGHGEWGGSHNGRATRHAETESADEVEEMELASELLEVSDEAELDQFVGKLIRRAGRAVGYALRPDTARALAGLLRGTARHALPALGRSLGGWVAPGVGGAAGAGLAARAGRLLGLELEGLSPPDQEFEVARQFVRFARASARGATTSRNGAAPRAAAASAAIAAARRYAPGLVPRLGAVGGAPRGGARRARSGRWVRRDNAIVVLDA
jgi:hypothetical protein